MIGVQIKKLRLQKGYSLSALAEKSGISMSYISFMERNRQKTPSIRTLSKLAEPLGVSVDYFLLNDSGFAFTKTEKWDKLIQKAIDDEMTVSDFHRYCKVESQLSVFI